MVPGLDQSSLLRVFDLKHSTTLLRGIKHDNYVDVMFICKGNVKVFAQKLVLISVSPFMKLLLSHVSCCPHNMFCISLPDINPMSLQLVLNFLYEGVMKVRASELHDFSDVLYVLGVEIPPTATATVVETMGLSELPLSCPRVQQQPQAGSHLEANEPVDPLNVPDYYHDPVMPYIVTCPTLLPSTSKPVSAMSSNPAEHKVANHSAEVKHPIIVNSGAPSTHGEFVGARANTSVEQLEGTINSKKKNDKSTLSEEHLRFLDQEFLKNPAPSLKYKKYLAKKLKVNVRDINNWFSNTRRKIRAKRQHLLGVVPEMEPTPVVGVKEEVN